MSVHKKLMKARISLQAMKLKKSGQNKFAGYQYFELADFIPQVQEIFLGMGLCGVISYGKELATLTITDIEDSTELAITSPMSTAALKGCHEVQQLGAVETYIRRYLWVTAMEIVEHDALDSSAGPAPKKESAIPATFRSSPTMGVFESLTSDRQDVVTDAAMTVIERVGADDLLSALEQYDEFYDDEKTALHGKLPSHIRTALRKFKESLNQQKEAA